MPIALPPAPSPGHRESRPRTPSLAKKFDPAGYLSNTRDIVALMTLEHQTGMTDLMIRVSWEARVLDQDKNSGAAAQARFESDLQALVQYMLFADEFVLQDPVTGVSTFTQTFPQRGPRDRQGRSLRDFDLHTRLFRYPLSYMVYSEAFDNMPASVRNRIYQLVYDVLTGRDKNPAYNRLSESDRKAVLEIVRNTKPGLPSYWQ